MKIGELEISIVSGGRLHLDGGTMFGVVPKALWERSCPADDRNRIVLDTNCLLIRTASQTILVDTGYGPKLSDRERKVLSIPSGNPLFENLAKHNVTPDQIDVVILTHLHFDHAGGCTLQADLDGEFVSAFPNAKYVVQRQEWEDATSGVPELKGNYYIDELLTLEPQLEFVDGDQALTPEISLSRTGGHTRGHQIIRLESQGERAIYLGDACPTSAHLRTFWNMAYDVYPLDTRRVKPQLLTEAAEQESLVIFDHDPEVKAAYLTHNARGNVILKERVELI